MTNVNIVQPALRSAIGVQAPYELLDADGTTIAVKRQGLGVPVICLHATGHGGRDFESFAKVMATKGFEIFSLDWPGQGASPEDASGQGASARRYADLLEDVLPQVCAPGQQPILLGNSIGGAAALEFACRHPDRVRALVLCNPGGLAPLDALARGVIGLMVKFFAAGARGANWFPRAFGLYYRLVLPAAPASDHRARIVAAGAELAPILRQAWDSFRGPGSDLRAAASGLKIPVLFAWAKQDQIVAWSRSRRAVLAMPNAEVKLFRGGHAAFLEDPDAFNAAFEAFTGHLAA